MRGGEWSPPCGAVRRVYRKGEIVSDFETHAGPAGHTEPGGTFRCLADHFGGFLNPRYVVLDRHGEFWERVQ